MCGLRSTGNQLTLRKLISYAVPKAETGSSVWTKKPARSSGRRDRRKAGSRMALLMNRCTSRSIWPTADACLCHGSLVKNEYSSPSTSALSMSTCVWLSVRMMLLRVSHFIVDPPFAFVRSLHKPISWKEYPFSRKRGGGFEVGSKMWISHAGFVRRTPSSNAESAFEPNEYTTHGRPLCRISLTPHVHLPPSKLNSETKLVRSSVHGQSYTGASSDITAPSFKGLSWKRGVPSKFHQLVSVLVVQR
mmetsp:Transcript_304/g.943  ORF Transcript_304/g.943 Transcript_304/m.943 type:complete len:247 (-) Transcript_304:129-869(-)